MGGQFFRCLFYQPKQLITIRHLRNTNTLQISQRVFEMHFQKRGYSENEINTSKQYVLANYNRDSSLRKKIKLKT